MEHFYMKDFVCVLKGYTLSASSSSSLFNVMHVCHPLLFLYLLAPLSLLLKPKMTKKINKYELSTTCRHPALITTLLTHTHTSMWCTFKTLKIIVIKNMKWTVINKWLRKHFGCCEKRWIKFVWKADAYCLDIILCEEVINTRNLEGI